MNRTMRILGGTSIVLAPLAIGAGDQLRMAAEPPASAGLDSEYGMESVLANLSAISEHQELFLAGASLVYVGALLTIPAMIAIWMMSVDRSRRWAWVGAVMATLGVAGQLVHVAAYHGVTLAALRHEDREAAAEFILGAESTPFMLAMFAPYFLAFLCVLPQVVGLRRARVIPLWASLAAGAGTLFFIVAGSTPWSSAVWTVLLVAGLAPAAAMMLRIGRVHRVTPFHKGGEAVPA